MTDLRYMGKNNQKKTSSVCVSAKISVDDHPLNNGEQYKIFTLPENSMITRGFVLSYYEGVGYSEIDVILRNTYSSGSIVDSLIDHAYIGSQAFPTGRIQMRTLVDGTSDIVVTKSPNSPTVPSGILYRIGIEFVELDLANGAYTI